MRKVRQLASIKGTLIINPVFADLFKRGDEINKYERQLFRILNRSKIREIMSASHYSENFEKFKNPQP
jgi:hypothetical protein